MSINTFPNTVFQGGTWSVTINGQPVAVSQSGTWNVNIANTATQPAIITHFGIPQPVYLADTEHQYDDDGYLQVTLRPDDPVTQALEKRFTTTAPVSGTVTANQGTAAASSGAWPIKLIDSAGTNTATVKPAATGASSGDPALVVVLSPNSPLGTGNNTIGVVNQGTAANATAPWPTSNGIATTSSQFTANSVPGATVNLASAQAFPSAVFWIGTPGQTNNVAIISGSIAFEFTQSGSDWAPLPVVQVGGNGLPITTYNLGNGAATFVGNHAGSAQVRVRLIQQPNNTVPITITGSAQSNAVYVAGGSLPLPVGAAQESTGNLQKIGELLELILIELRVHSVQKAGLQDAVSPDPDTLRTDLNLSLQ